MGIPGPHAGDSIREFCFSLEFFACVLMSSCCTVLLASFVCVPAGSSSRGRDVTVYV